jgi:hypothetical protein
MHGIQQEILHYMRHFKGVEEKTSGRICGHENGRRQNYE